MAERLIAAVLKTASDSGADQRKSLSCLELQRKHAIGGEELGALLGVSGAGDPGLAALAKAWPNLPDEVRSGILRFAGVTLEKPS